MVVFHQALEPTPKENIGSYMIERTRESEQTCLVPQLKRRQLPVTLMDILRYLRVGCSIFLASLIGVSRSITMTRMSQLYRRQLRFRSTCPRTLQTLTFSTAR